MNVIEENPHVTDPTTPDVGGTTPFGSQAARWLSLGASTLIFTLLQLQYLLDRGRLSRTPTGDDIAYINDGIGRLDGVYAHGWIHIVPDYFRNPPHSPLSSFLAFVGAMIFGIKDWPPYVMNGVIILALLWSADHLMRGARPWHRVLACAYVLTIPFAANAVGEFRPDLIWGLASAMAIILPLRTSLVFASRQYQFACGAWLAVTLLAKPATSPLTLITVGLAWCLALACDYVDTRRTLPLKRLAATLAVCAAPALAIAGPHYLVDYRGIYDYVAENSFGPHKNLWHLSGGWKFQAAYFLLYDGGKFMLGGQIGLIATILVGGGVILIRDRRVHVSRYRRGVCLGIVTVAGYTFIAINPHKNQYFGAEFHALLLLGTIVVLRMLAKDVAPALGRRLGDIAIVAVVIAGFVGWRFPSPWSKPGSDSAAESNLTVRSIAACVFENIPARGRLFVTGYGWVGSGTIRFLVRQQGKIIENTDFHREDDQSLYRGAMDDADVVVAAESGVGEFQKDLPSYGILDQTLAMIRARPDFKQIGAMRSKTGKFFFVFAQIKPPHPALREKIHRPDDREKPRE